MKQAPQLLIIKSNLDSVPADKLGVVIAKQGVIKSVGVGLVDSSSYPFYPLFVSPIGWVHKPKRRFKSWRIN